jgi:2-desacetyl-2-hydroxyethyl bacteriochlorophyllide A dehydrogenase
MKAAVITHFNAPWEVKQVPTPEPTEGQVLIKIHASGLCGTDLHVHHGMLPVKTPLIAGHEPVGEIVKLGPGVLHLKLHDRVGVSWHQMGCGRCHYCQSKRDLYCDGMPGGAITWMQLGGGHAEYMLAYAEACTLIPEGLSYEEAAPLFCAGYTVSSGYHNAFPATGDVVAVLGIGGLGHIALQMAKAKGHKVIAITEQESKKELCKKLGADVVIVGQSGLGQKLKAAGGADIILDCSNNNKAAQDVMGGLKPEGRLVIMGIDPKPLEVSSVSLIHNQAKIIGSTQNKRSDLVDILDLAASGKVKPMIEVFSLEDCNKALEKLQDQSIRFRAVLKII